MVLANPPLRRFGGGGCNQVCLCCNLEFAAQRLPASPGVLVVVSVLGAGRVHPPSAPPGTPLPPGRPPYWDSEQRRGPWKLSRPSPRGCCWRISPEAAGRRRTTTRRRRRVFFVVAVAAALGPLVCFGCPACTASTPPLTPPGVAGCTGVLGPGARCKAAARGRIREPGAGRREL